MAYMIGGVVSTANGWAWHTVRARGPNSMLLMARTVTKYILSEMQNT